MMFQQQFPYINPPLAGSPNDLSVNLTLQQSANVQGPYANIAAKYNSANSTLSTTPTGENTGFYRTASDQHGIKLGNPTVTSTNVTMGVQVP